MRRRLFKLVTIVSLLLSAATAALWAASFWRMDAIKYSDGQTSLVVASGPDGIVGCAYGDGMSNDWYAWRGAPGDTVLNGLYPPSGRCGFAFQCYRWKAGSFALWGSARCPDWFIALPGALLGAWRFRRARSNPVSPRRCPACGYNLTGNISGVCPECGTTAPSPQLPPQRTPVP